MDEKTALVLEGGSMRCLFTAGVLDAFLDWGLKFPCVTGSSAGAFSAVGYLAGQRGRTARINLRFAGDERYLGVRSLLRHHSVFNFDFLFGEIADSLEPLDRAALAASPARFAAFATDVATGESVAFEKGKCSDIYLACRASGSMPLLAPIVQMDGRACMDGGIAAPVPYQWAFDQGCEKIVVVLTQAAGYRKKAVSPTMARALARHYRLYPAFVDCCLSRPDRYNAEQLELSRLEREGRAFLIRPDRPVTVSRVEKDVDKLHALYLEGFRVADARKQALLKFLGQ